MYFDGLDNLLDVAKLGKVALGRLFAGPRMHLVSFLLVFGVLASPVSAAEGAYLLSPADDVGTRQQVRVAIEIQGELKTNPDGKKVTRLPMSVNASLTYEEQMLTASSGARRTARYYEEAAADLRINQTQQRVSLADEHRLMVVQSSRDAVAFLSPHGSLARDELDLIDVPGNSALSPNLLPDRETSIGEKWSPAENVVALLLGLEAVSKSDVTAVLTKVEGDIAVIDMSGLVQGAVGGVATEIELKAKLNFTLSQRRLTWLAMALKENRAVGHAEPGFETVSRVRVAMQPMSGPNKLTDKLLADVPAEGDTGSGLLAFKSEKSGFRILHDKRWRVMVDRQDVAILRFVDRGDLIAQCNISPLPDLSPGKHLPIADFKQEIEQALGNNFGQIVEATQSTTDSGLRVLRIVASGTSSDLPIQWIYYHVSSEQGRRAAYVFTLEARLLERFGATDDLLTSSFEFVDRPSPAPAKPSAAKPAAGKPAVGKATVERNSLR